MGKLDFTQFPHLIFFPKSSFCIIGKCEVSHYIAEDDLQQKEEIYS